jgi:hypothetical protein
MAEDAIQYFVDADHLAIESSSLVDDLGEFLAKKVPSSGSGDAVVREGNRLTVNAKKGFTKRDLRVMLNKFLHQTNTAVEYRPIAVALSPMEYKIFRKKEKGLPMM